MFDLDMAEAEAYLGLTRRSVPGDTVRSLLDHRWVGMATFLFVVGALLQNTALMAMTGFMLVVIAFSWAWSRGALQNVVYARRFQYRRVFPGEVIELQIIIENRKFLPLGWVQIEDPWPGGFGPVDEEVLVYGQGLEGGSLINTYALRWNQRVRRRIPLLARQRGIYEVGPARMVSGDPFSLFERERLSPHVDYLIVYPEIKSLAEFGLSVKNPLGEYRVQQRLFEDLNRIMGVRDHRPEDGLRHVHWKATARVGALQAKVYEPTRNASIMLCLNVATFEQHWLGVWPDMMEALVTLAASLAAWGVEQHHAVGIIANGAFPHADQPFRVLPNRSRDQLTRILETLAGVTYYVTADFGRFLLDESPDLPWGATLVLLTAFVNDAILGSIVRLRDSGRQLVLICLSQTPPDAIPGVLIHHLPFEGEAPELPEPDAEAAEHETPRQRFLRERERTRRERERTRQERKGVQQEGRA